MKVSFIIVALNSERALGVSLKSLVAQDYPHDKIEVILVDGCSCDNTKDVMIKFGESEKSFESVLVLDNPGRYLACGWNVALAKATGDIILRVDAHTEFPQDFVSKNVECIEGGEDICGGKVISILEDNRGIDKVLLEAENSMFGGGFTYFRRGEKSRYTNTLAFAAYRKTVFDKVGSYNERLVRTEDNDMHYRMRCAGYKFFFNPDIVSYRYSRSSFAKLLRQKFLNGYWVGLSMGVCPKAFSVFYFAPFALVMAVIFSSILCVWSTVPLILLLLAYAFVLLLTLMGPIVKGDLYKEIVLLPFIILCLHISYGLGTIKGLLNLPKMK